MEKVNVICLKVGKKYSAEYVNKLYNMVTRNLTIDCEFFCLTEDPAGIDKKIITLPLETSGDIEGWWYKTFVFDPSYPLSGRRTLFLDLDVVIVGNINKLFTYESNKFTIIKDFYSKRKGLPGVNSSCFLFTHGTNSDVYSDFIHTKDKTVKRLHGDQDWIFEKIPDFVTWPEEWIKSFKWEMTDNTNSDDIEIPANTCIAVFHGNPKPHTISSKWIETHWR